MNAESRTRIFNIDYTWTDATEKSLHRIYWLDKPWQVEHDDESRLEGLFATHAEAIAFADKQLKQLEDA